MKVLILGADGFIGRHIAFGLRAEGAEVIACARRSEALREMGFEVLPADLSDPATHEPGFWRAVLAGGVHLVNCAGLLTGSDEVFEAVHIKAPLAALQALDGGRMVQISAVGIDSAETAFARWRREAEAALSAEAVTILRPGLVVGETSYGGSSLVRAFAALPFVQPVVGDGRQPFNPVHAADLAQVVAECLRAPPGPGPFEIGGPETLSQAELGAAYRRWLGLSPARVLRLPLGLARRIGQLGEALKLGPISRAGVAQLEAGVTANSTALFEHIRTRPRGISEALRIRPAGTQDLWQARLYMLKPLIRITMSLLWIGAAIGAFLSPDASVAALMPGRPEGLALLAMRGGGMIELVLGLALLAHWSPRLTAIAQVVWIALAVIGLGLLAPGLWLLPMGGLVKMLPVLLLALVHLALLDER